VQATASDQLAYCGIAVFPADDRVQRDEPRIPRRQRLQLRQQLEIVGIVIVTHSTVPPV
jgi:hypothetical protein